MQNNQISGEVGRQFLEDYSKAVEKSFDAYMKEKVSQSREVGSIPAELVSAFWKTARLGKKIRGALMLLGYQMAGGKNTKTMQQASLSIEVLHAGLLVHDDIMDNDNLRRGLPSMHTQFSSRGRELGIRSNSDGFGSSMAINIGDAAFFYSWDMLLHSNFDPTVLLAASQVYTDYVLRIVYGQVLDVANVALHKMSEKDILNILRYKTAEYTGVLPLLLGATLAGCTNTKKLEAIKQYGLAFGWAFQIQDDILGLFGNEKSTGKPVGSDIKEGKNTLLMLYTLKHASSDEKMIVSKALGNSQLSTVQLHKVLEIVKQTGAYDQVVKLGWKYVEEGREAIEHITKDKKNTAILESLIYYMMERTL